MRDLACRRAPTLKSAISLFRKLQEGRRGAPFIASTGRACAGKPDRVVVRSQVAREAVHGFHLREGDQRTRTGRVFRRKRRNKADLQFPSNRVYEPVW